MNIDDLTIGQLKEINSLLCLGENKKPKGLSCMISKKVIIRTYSAGVWFGFLEQKDGNEVILRNARRMLSWWAKEGISLSAVSIHGIKHDESKIAEAVDAVWLEAIEILPCTESAINSIDSAPNAKA